MPARQQLQPHPGRLRRRPSTRRRCARTGFYTVLEGPRQGSSWQLDTGRPSNWQLDTDSSPTPPSLLYPASRQAVAAQGAVHKEYSAQHSLSGASSCPHMSALPLWRGLAPASAVLLLLVAAMAVTATEQPLRLLFPGGPPVCRNLSVVDLSAASADVKLAATTLQGVINGRGAACSRVYLLLAAWDTYWNTTLVARGRLPANQTLLSADEYFVAFNGSFSDVYV